MKFKGTLTNVETASTYDVSGEWTVVTKGASLFPRIEEPTAS